MVVWNLADIYNPKERDKLIAGVKKQVAQFKDKRKLLTEKITPSDFMSLVKEYEKIGEVSAKLNAFAGLWQSENTSDPDANAHELTIHQLSADLGNEVLFFSLWFAKLDDKVALPIIKNAGKYQYYLERVRADRPFLLAEKEEQIINQKNVFGISAVTKLYDIFTGAFTFEFEGKQLTQEEINQFKENKDRKKRMAAYDLVLGRYGKEESVLGEIYKSIVGDWGAEQVKLRGFKSPIGVRNHSNDVPDKAVEALLAVVKKNVKLFQDYFALKAKLLNLKDFDRYDLYVPMKESDRSFSYEESKKITLETYKQFDEKAHAMASKIFQEGHVHSDIVKGKRSGAFCYSVTNNITPYVLLNHVGKQKDVFTMMHEFGHGIHSLAAHDQTNFTFHSALPMAETASIFGEMLLAQRLLKEGGKDDKIAVLVRLLDNQYASIIRQAYFVLFEIAAHEAVQKGATVPELNKIYMNNLKEQFGKIKVGDVFQHEWKYIPHIYHTPFYCYAYAFGNLLTLALYRMYEKEGKAFVPKYLKLLSYGGSKAPAEMLKELNVNIESESFWQQGFDLIKEELDELKKLVK